MNDAQSPFVDGLTIGAMLRRTATERPDDDAHVFPRLDPDGRLADPAPESCYRLSYRGLDEAVDGVAKALVGAGIEQGDHVAVWATNWPRWVLLQFATARIGAVMVNVNPAYRANEFGYVLGKSRAKTLFLIDRFRASDYFGTLAEVVPELADRDPRATGSVSASFPVLERVVSMNDGEAAGVLPWADFEALGAAVTDEQLAAREAALGPDDPINVQYTSGTTGYPKGATLSHRNLLLNAFHIGARQGLSAVDRVCVPVPFYHCFGCVLGVLACAEVGAAMIVPNEHFDADATLAAIESERATALYGVPTMFIAQLESPSYADRDTSSLRTGIMAGSPCPIELMKRVVGDMGCAEVTIAYGLTEASPVITQTGVDDSLEHRVSTVGRPLPGLEVGVVDPESGAFLGDGEQGELVVRGHCVMLGYHDDPEATAAAIDADGWLHSGDLALRQSDGFYRITGRIKDMICRGGENVYPREIEEFLYTHPGVMDVAVVGVPDPRFVEEIAAWIVPRDPAAVADGSLTEDAIREFCRASIAHYKVPRYVKFVDDYPKTVTGKIQKFRIRELIIEELGLDEAETA